jgi:orotate phosphoribosyltransferase
MLKDSLIAAKAVKFGDFTLTSGKKSNYYVDMKTPVANSPALLRELSEELATRVYAKTIAGVELGAVPLLIATAVKLGIPYAIIRKEAREHGVKDPVVGSISSGETVDIIEDVVTTGGSVLRAAKLLRERGVIVNRVICVVDREEGGAALLMENGIELVPIVKVSEIFQNGPK